MKIKVLQGINLQSNITRIIATLDGTPDTRIIEELKGYHKIFLENYLVDGNTVVVDSYLPHLWKELFKSINQIATGELSHDEVREYILRVPVREQVHSMSTIPIIYAAIEMGYEVNQMFVREGVQLHKSGASNTDNRRYAIGVGREHVQTASSSSSRDSALVKKLQADKYYTNLIVSQMGLPIAKWMMIESLDHLKEVFETFPKPFVLKPVGLSGGHGVTTNIMSWEQAEAAYNLVMSNPKKGILKDSQFKIMIQQQVKGEDYRLLVIDGELKIATKRIPAFVVGDGQSTIAQLIAVINQDPRRNMSDPTHTLKQIVIDEMMHTYLNEQGLTIDSVPAKDQKVYVRKVASMSQGGVTEDFTPEVHPQIKYFAESLAQTLKAFVLGVDIICQDIKKPLTIENGSFIEMNTMPEAYLNSYPVYGTQYPEVGRWIITGLMKDKQPTNKVVYIGGTVEEVIAYGQTLEDRTGLCSEGKIYINGELMNSEMPNWVAIEAIKLNGSLDNIILHYPAPQSIEEVGLGFNKVDTLILATEIEYEARLQELNSLGYIQSIVKN